MREIHPSLDTLWGDSKFFNVNEIINCNFENTDHILLLFLSSFSFSTPFHYLIANFKFKLFNDLMDKIENNLENIIKLIECDQFIEKIVAMFIFMLENNYSYPKHALENYYCDLIYERTYFDNYDDDEDFSENDDEDINAVVMKKKSRQTAGSITNQNVILINRLLKMINKNVQNNVNFSENNCFNVFSF